MIFGLKKNSILEEYVLFKKTIRYLKMVFGSRKKFDI